MTQKEAPRSGNSGARDQRRANISDPSIARLPDPAQAQNQFVDVAHVGSIWKSPRDKSTCIQAGLKSYAGSAPYLDLRIYQADAQGRMRPTSKGITCSAPRLMQLAKLVGDAARKAHALGLTQVSS